MAITLRSRILLGTTATLGLLGLGLRSGLFERAATTDRSDAAPPRIRMIAGRLPGQPAPPSPPELRGGEFGFAAYSYPGPWVPDCALAAGPDHLVVPVNRFVRFFTKTAVMTYDAPLFGTGGFFSIASDTTIVFDPVALFDPHSGRYFVAAGGRDPERLYLAVSDDGDPNGTWHQYEFDSSVLGQQTDFPCIGVDSSTVYVSVKMEGALLEDRWKGVVMWEKASILNGGPAVVTRRRFSAVFVSITFAGVTTFDSGAPAQYFASNPNGPFAGASAIRLTALRDPQGERFFDTFDLPIPQWWYLQFVPEQGSAGGISNEPGTFYKHGVYRNGRLYVANSAAPTAAADRAVVHWYEIDMNGWPTSAQNPSLAQWGTIDLGLTPKGNPISTIYGDIAVDAFGNIAIACNRTSANEIASVVRAYRKVGDPPGTMPDIAIWKTGTAPHDGSVGGAWGDYSSIDADPSAAGAFWGHAEFREPGAWRTWIGQLIPAATPAPELATAHGFRLSASPNPFAARTMLSCTTDRSGPARIDVLDVSGRRVRTLFSGRREPGSWEAEWDGRDEAGCAVVDGVYFVRFETAGRSTTRKVTILR